LKARNLTANDANVQLTVVGGRMGADGREVAADGGRWP
jgi:hypothetical protein